MAKKSTKPKSATSYKETAFGILPRSKVVELEKEGVQKAQQLILRLSEKKAKITPESIRDIHREGFGFIFPDWTGKFRTEDVTVDEYEPPHYNRVSELIKNVCDDLYERSKYLPPLADEEKYLAQLIELWLGSNIALSGFTHLRTIMAGLQGF